MNLSKCQIIDYTDFITATPRQVTATEAAGVQPERKNAPAHDAFTRLLQRLEPDASKVWLEAETQVCLNDGIFVIDDSTPDKPFAERYRTCRKTSVRKASRCAIRHQSHHPYSDRRRQSGSDRLSHI